MPTPTYTPLATTTLATAAATITFSSISGSHRDLIVTLDGESTSAASVGFRLNSDTGSNYISTAIRTNAPQTFVNIATLGNFINSLADANFTFNAVFTIMDYSATDKHKSVIASSAYQRTDNVTQRNILRYASTSAITTVQVLASAGNFAVGTKMTLHGIAS